MVTEKLQSEQKNRCRLWVTFLLGAENQQGILSYDYAMQCTTLGHTYSSAMNCIIHFCFVLFLLL